MIASPASTQPPAAVLTSLDTLTAMPPRTLALASDTFRTLKELGTALQSTAFADAGSKIVEAADAALSGDNRPRTLPQAQEKLLAIRALLPSVPGAQGSPATTPAEANPFVEKIARLRARLAKSTATPGAALAPNVATDSATYDRYAALKGSERQSFFAVHREALVREHARRAKVPTPEQSDVLAKYRALTGADRRAFYAQHERELWTAYRRS